MRGMKQYKLAIDQKDQRGQENVLRWVSVVELFFWQYPTKRANPRRRPNSAMQPNLAHLNKSDRCIRDVDDKVMKGILGSVDKERVCSAGREQDNRGWQRFNMHHVGRMKRRFSRVYSNLKGIIRLNCSDQDMLMPAHATTNRELILCNWIFEGLPAATVYTVMRKTSTTSDGNVSSIVRYDGTSNWPLVR